MVNPNQIQFLYTTCNDGSEKSLKQELNVLVPNLVPAFSRPGFVTFKNKGSFLTQSDIARLQESSVYLRIIGNSLFIDCAATPLFESEEFEKIAFEAHFNVHIWIRDSVGIQNSHPERIKNWEFEQTQFVEKISQKFTKFNEIKVNQKLKPGNLVLDCVGVDQDKIKWGIRTIGEFESGLPANRWSIHLPEKAPSRAYLKCKESIESFRLPIKEGQRVLELGSSPGGAAFALSELGLSVTGVDPGEMDPIFKKDQRLIRLYQHIRSSVFDLESADIPKSLDWIFIDMNTDPRVSLGALEKIVQMRSDIKGGILTAKLGHVAWSQEAPFWMDRLRRLGFSFVQAKQLHYNRQEITVFCSK